MFAVMTMLVRYLTHPQVRIDPAVPVPSWGLSDVGHSRVRALVAAGWLKGTTQVISSGERKAIETAEPIAAALGIELAVRERMHENDRSATGFLPPNEFESVANEFFAHPGQSIRGWERALDAQARIIREAEGFFRRHHYGHMLVVGHGVVGTLMFCHYSKTAISRSHDQPNGGGYYFTMTLADRRVLHPWRCMEDAFEV